MPAAVEALFCNVFILSVSSLLSSVIVHSVNNTVPAILAAFSKANLVTLVGSIIPFFLKSIGFPVSISIPFYLLNFPALTKVVCPKSIASFLS